jgi:hypothetical protein
MPSPVRNWLGVEKPPEWFRRSTKLHPKRQLR